MQTLKLIAIVLVAMALGDYVVNNGVITNKVLITGKSHIDRVFGRIF